ncbi:hypothetical protein V7S43_010814 [Phytophthora oleae]|uniref:Uncharacterized protein n=1 Tax=Phytophthora oleae TaxID=2107226 RepID=A0ABD3FEJ3_9STRA
MDPSRQDKLSSLIDSFNDTFQLKEAVEKTRDREKKSFWSDEPVATVKEEDFKEEHEEAGDADAGSDLELDLDDSPPPSLRSSRVGVLLQGAVSGSLSW